MHLGSFFHDCNPFYHTHFYGLLLIPFFSTMVKSMSLNWLHNHVVVFAWNDYIFLVISLVFCSSVVLFNTYIHRGCGICGKIMWISCWSIYYRIQGQLVYNFFPPLWMHWILCTYNVRCNWSPKQSLLFIW